jgi:hypothetical protein
MPAPMPIYCSRCSGLATVEIGAGTPDTALRRAAACDRHRTVVRRWAAHVGTPTSTPINQTMLGQLALFPITEVD